MEQARHLWVRRVRRILVAGLAMTAVALDFNGDPTRYFNYFTILTNLSIGCWFVAAAIMGRGAERASGLRLSLTIYGLVTMSVYWVLLAPTYHLEGLRVLATVVLHAVVPLSMALEDLLVPWPPLNARGPMVIVIFPLAYIVGAFVRGEMTGWYPYFFLDQSKMGGWSGVTLFLLALFATFLALAYLWRWCVQKRQEGQRRKATAS